MRISRRDRIIGGKIIENRERLQLMWLGDVNRMGEKRSQNRPRRGNQQIEGEDDRASHNNKQETK